MVGMCYFSTQSAYATFIYSTSGTSAKGVDVTYETQLTSICSIPWFRYWHSQQGHLKRRYNPGENQFLFMKIIFEGES